MAGWSGRRVPGADGWSPEEMKDWPDELANMLAQFYELVELKHD